MSESRSTRRRHRKGGESTQLSRARRVIVVGAGVSGIGIARRLKQADIPFTILEKAPKVGGTWFHNKYPGLKCDVPVIGYRYSFESLAGGSLSLLPTAAELQQRVERLCDDSGVRENIRFGAEVASSAWVNDHWELTLTDGDVVMGDVVVFATGFLHHANIPAIPGAETFKGRVVHSAQWDPSIDYTGKRVAVIGSGSSGCQLVSAFAGEASRTFMFARNPQWILPVPDLTMPAWLARTLTKHPRLDRGTRTLTLAAVRRLLGRGSSKNGIERKLFSWLCRKNLATVKDPDLRAGLTPNDPPLCKRPVMTTSFYPAVQRDDVQLVTDRIETITPNGVRTVDGVEHELDLIVLATGYKSQNYMRPIEIAGLEGVTLNETWSANPFAYHSLAIPGFPNMLMAMGPLSPRLHIGPHESGELLAEYVTQFAQELQIRDVVALTPSKEATDAWVKDIGEEATTTTLASCTSWYQGSDGSPLVFTGSKKRWHAETGKLNAEDFDILTAVDVHA